MIAIANISGEQQTNNISSIEKVNCKLSLFTYMGA